MPGLVTLSITRSIDADAVPVERRFDTDLTINQLKVFLLQSINIAQYFSIIFAYENQSVAF